MVEQTVLFLCTGNFYRSRYAEELFNHLAQEQGLAWRATSRGLYHIMPHPDNEGPLSFLTVEALEQMGIPIHGRERMPERASYDDFDAADLIIALQEREHRPMLAANYPAFEGHITYWDIGDVAEISASEALPQLNTAVRALVQSL